MKKLTVLVLAGLMVLGLAAGATSASVWTDKEVTTVYGSTGSVDITTIKTLYFDPYIQPGETLVVKWWVKNVGKCPVTITVAVTGVPGYLTWKFYPGLNLGNLNPGYKKNVALSIRMPYGISQNHSNKTFAVKITFTATQNQHRIQTP